MANKYGKLFKSSSTNRICYFSYDAKENYYAFIQEMLQQGYHQCIVTSDILSGCVEVTSIEFMIEDDELDDDITNIVKLMKKNSGYWEILKQKLSFLSEKDSIEIKRVSFRKTVEKGSLFSIQVNGIVIVSDFDFDNILKSISKIMEGCIK